MAVKGAELSVVVPGALDMKSEVWDTKVTTGSCQVRKRHTSGITYGQRMCDLLLAACTFRKEIST
jgi:hypothetical protein